MDLTTEEIDFLVYIKGTEDIDPKAIFCTTNKKYHAIADRLINKGVIVEVEGPGGEDRAYAFKKRQKQE